MPYMPSAPAARLPPRPDWLPFAPLSLAAVDSRHVSRHVSTSSRLGPKHSDARRPPVAHRQPFHNVPRTAGLNLRPSSGLLPEAPSLLSAALDAPHRQCPADSMTLRRSASAVIYVPLFVAVAFAFAAVGFVAANPPLDGGAPTPRFAKPCVGLAAVPWACRAPRRRAPSAWQATGAHHRCFVRHVPSCCS